MLFAEKFNPGLNPLQSGSRLLQNASRPSRGSYVLIPFKAGLVYYAGKLYIQKGPFVLIPFKAGLVYYAVLGCKNVAKVS